MHWLLTASCKGNMSFSQIKNFIKRNVSSEVIERIQRSRRYLPKEIWKEQWKDRTVKTRYKRLNKRKREYDVVKVAFLVQMAEIWDKQLPVYAAMQEDERFEPQLIVVPPYDLIKREITYDYKDNYFLLNYEQSIPAYSEGKWIDFSDRQFDYVFYQRPYDVYLPKQLQSYQITSFSRCCYIPYGYWPFKNDLCGYNREFFRCVYFAFMESKENASYIQKMEDDEKRILFCGYPSLDNIEYSSVFDIDSVLWTPRWSYDAKLGGSHFFEFKDDILKLSNQFPKISITIRPHPLAFQNYVAEGLMTLNEVQEYMEKAKQHGIEFDKNKNIEDTFSNTGVLITDISSIIYTYFMSTKPIIFCNTDIELSPSFKALMKGMYIAESWIDVIGFYKELKSGNDYLAIERKHIAERLREANKSSAKKILDILANEFTRITYSN